MKIWSLYIHHKKKEILFLGKGPTDSLDDVLLKAKKKFSVILLSNKKNFV